LAGRTAQPVFAAQAKSSGLPPAILSQMNAASAKFTSAQADVRQELFDSRVKDTETQTGQIYFIRKGGSTQMGMKLTAPDAPAGSPPAQIVEFKDNKAEILNTGTGQVDVLTATGKNQGRAETMMTLGFGGSGTDLQKEWNITDLGSEQMSDGSKQVQVEKLDLVSNDPSLRNNFSHITIWVDPIRDVSLKQLLFLASGGKPTGDTRTAYYTNIRLNEKVNSDAFAIKCKGKCNYVQH
jgi:outer membrane lipoprotein-sorting protein